MNLKSTSLVLRPISVLLCFLPLFSQPPAPVFKATANLQSIAVQVAGKSGDLASGLSASNFTLLEDGRPQKIAFFAAEHQPVSLAILLDSSRSMDFGGKLARARVLLAPILRGNRPDDEIFFMPFTDEAGPFEHLNFAQRLQPPVFSMPGHRGSALYDALASALCHMRTAQNVRQAIVVLTDGVDEHSRLSLEQLLELVRSSIPQVFMIGLYNKPEYQIYAQGRKTVTIVGLREIDNPVLVFNRLAKESGAESFFPSSDQSLKNVLDRISAILQGQYTLAYYPQKVDSVRKIDVKVNRRGLKVLARRIVGPESAAGAVHFAASSCDVSPYGHPYPWELRLTSNAFSPMIYHDDFSDPQSGWPNRAFDPNTSSKSHYISKGYELYRWSSPTSVFSLAPGVIAAAGNTEIAAYGPWWDNFRASALLETHTDGPNSGVGIVTNVNEQGYYALLLRASGNGKRIAFEFLKGNWNGMPSALIPWTLLASLEHPAKVHRLSVQCDRGRILLKIDDQQVGAVQDTTFKYGLVGFGVFGNGRATVHDLLVEALR